MPVGAKQERCNGKWTEERTREMRKRRRYTRGLQMAGRRTRLIKIGSPVCAVDNCATHRRLIQATYSHIPYYVLGIQDPRMSFWKLLFRVQGILIMDNSTKNSTNLNDTQLSLSHVTCISRQRFNLANTVLVILMEPSWIYTFHRIILR